MPGRGKGNFKYRASPRKDSADGDGVPSQTSTAVKLVILGSKPTIAEVNRWQDAAMEWGGVHVRNGMHRIADRTNPGELPELFELEPPDREADGYRTPDPEGFMIMNDGEVAVLDRPRFERQKSRMDGPTTTVEVPRTIWATHLATAGRWRVSDGVRMVSSQSRRPA